MEIQNRKESCLWLKNDVCKIQKDFTCPDDCSLVSISWDKDSIIKRMKEEEAEVYRLKKEGIYKNKEVMLDKIMGIYVLQKALNNFFGHIEPVVVDKDLEKNMQGGWRR